MSGFDYARTAASASRLLGRFGQIATFTRTAPADGSVSTFDARAVVASTVKHALGDSGIAVGDDKLLVESSAAPEPGDRVAYNGESRVIVDPVVAINPGGTRVLVECYARRG